MSDRLKRLLEERAQLWEGTQKPLVAIEGRDWTVEERTAFDTADERMKALDSTISDLEKALDAESRAAAARGRYEGLQAGEVKDEKRQKPGRERQHVDTEEYREAFMAWASRGAGGLSQEERKILQPGESRAQTTTTGSSGGYVIPQGFYNKLTEAMKAYGAMVPPELTLNDDGDGGFQDGTGMAGTTLIRTATGNPLPFPTVNDTSNVGARLAENAPITSQDIAFGQVTLNAWIYTSKLILVPWTLLQDSAFDMETFIPKVGGERLGRILNQEFTTGTGASMPRGVTLDSPVAITLANATTAVTYDNLVDLEHSVDPAYRPNGKFMFSDTTLAAIRKIKDMQGRPLWEPSFQVGAPSLFAGKPYVINNDMPAQASTAKHVLFGDFSQYVVRVARDASLIRLEERYADNLQTGFFVWCRADGALINAGTNPIKAITST